MSVRQVLFSTVAAIAIAATAVAAPAPAGAQEAAVAIDKDDIGGVVTGPNGLATLEPPTFRLTVELADGTTETHEPPGDKAEVCFALQLERFVDAALAGTPPVPGLDEAIASLELAERIARAAGVGRLVPA